MHAMMTLCSLQRVSQFDFYDLCLIQFNFILKGHRLSEKFLKSQDSASSDVAPTSDNSQQGVSDTDGNCLGATSPYYAAPFSHSKGKLKRFCNQDYDDLKRRSKLRGQLFEDREFIPSNRLLVDDNNQYIFSYGRMTRFDGNSIEWLRPHVRIK